MTDDASLSHRVQQLEQALGRRRIDRLLFSLVLIVVAGIAVVGYRQAKLLSAIDARHQSRDLEHAFWLLCHDNSTSQARTEAFLSLVAAENTEWRSARLSKLDLQGADLNGVELQGGYFDSSDMSQASLIGADFQFADLRLVNLTGCDVTKANFSGAKLLKATMDDAILRSAAFDAAVLQQVTARNADMAVCDLSDADLVMADLTGAQMVGAVLVGANLESAVLTNANIALADLSGAILDRADFTNCNWWRARGLTSAQIADFLSRFAPGEDVAESLRNDFRLWLDSYQSGSP